MHDLIFVFILVRNIVDGQHLNEKDLNFNVFYLSNDKNLIKKTRLAVNLNRDMRQSNESILTDFIHSHQ